MAPTLATATGITPQVLDDLRLQKLIENLHAIDSGQIANSLNSLSDLLRPYQTWVFEEQVDLHDWIYPLNVIDAALCHYMKTYPSMLLVNPVERRRGQPKALSSSARSLTDVDSVPASCYPHLYILLRFLEGLLRNSTSKSIFNSAEELVDLLAAADDETSDLALTALLALSLPPALHKQQAPEVQQHTTTLHNAKMPSHSRLTAIARGWGTRAMGLGLWSVIKADDSVHGQGSLPGEAGRLSVCYYSRESQNEVNEESQMVRIYLNESDIMVGGSAEISMDSTSDALTAESDQVSKKRRIGKIPRKETKSTAELYYLVLERAGGMDKIPSDRLFPLLADIRLARSFHSQAARIGAVERRLRALTTILHAHPSQEVMNGYFQAQPELCVEIVDLLRPTVSSANIAAASGRATETNSPLQRDAITCLSSCQPVPYTIRMLAVESLAALVARRDGSTGALSGSARLSTVLAELGIGKGYYLGLLPTLLRYSLASLDSPGHESILPEIEPEDLDDATMLDVGMAFVEATMEPLPPRIVQVERTLEFVDNLLTLTSTIVSTPTGTAALTDCGLIPALLATVAHDLDRTIQRLLPDSSNCSTQEILRVYSLLRFVLAQAVQILEGAIVTHGNALTAFHDLRGVEVLSGRLSGEIVTTGPDMLSRGQQKSEREELEHTQTFVSEFDTKIRSSQRGLLFSIITCLTVVFHQESTASTSATNPSGGAQIRQEGLTRALIHVMEHVSSYGGHVASLTATLLSDVMNSDPHVVSYIHESGIAKSFLSMVVGRRVKAGDSTDTYEPVLPPVPELVMAVPNVLSALSLTEDGAKVIYEINPFPSLMRIFYHPNYAMPKSRCLLNEITGIIGTGLDELMRHVERLKPLVMEAVANAMKDVVMYAEDLKKRENQFFFLSTSPLPDRGLEDERSCLMQYVLNFGQLLEQLLHNDGHCEPFVNSGGLVALMQLFPASLPGGFQFLTHASGLSSPSVSTLHHSTIEDSLSVAFKCIEFRYDSLQLFRVLMEAINDALDSAEQNERNLLSQEDTVFCLDCFPQVPVYQFDDSPVSIRQALLVSNYLIDVTNIQWLTSLLATALKSACHKSQESGTGWGKREKEWKTEISSENFTKIFGRLSDMHQSCFYDVCRVRTVPGFEERERMRQITKSPRLRFRLRIVCPEGAVVRDGIEIDSCATVGNMEMGEVVESFDRCVNSSGILRYRTTRGWVSEMTRGHGREPIAEIVGMWLSTNENTMDNEAGPTKRLEAAVPDVRTVATGILARLQISFSDLYLAVSRVIVQSIRTLTPGAISFDSGTQGSHVSTTTKLLSLHLKRSLNITPVREAVHQFRVAGDGYRPDPSHAAAAMYLGCMLSQAQSCLFDEKRERRALNFSLLVNLLHSDSIMHATSRRMASAVGSADMMEIESSFGLLEAASFVLRFSLTDLDSRSLGESLCNRMNESSAPLCAPPQKVSRWVAASFPPAISLLRRLLVTPVSTSPVVSVLSRIKLKDISTLVGLDDSHNAFSKSGKLDNFFQPEDIWRVLQTTVSYVVRELWSDALFPKTPPYLVHPVTNLIGEILVALEDISKLSKNVSNHSSSGDSRSGGTRLRDWLRERARPSVDGQNLDEDSFEASDEAILRLTEMGFTGEHAVDALESVRSNRVEVAMEYALSHPPPSPSTVERRRVGREERERQRAALQQATTSQLEADQNGSMNAEDRSTIPSQNSCYPEDSLEMEQNSSEDVGTAFVSHELKTWKKSILNVCCDILTKMPISKIPKHGEGDGDLEAQTVVVASFLLDAANRFPEDRACIVSRILDEIVCRITCIEIDLIKKYSIDDTNESSIAVLCHATVLFARALPRARVLILEKSLIGPLLSCTLGVAEANAANSRSDATWPMWLAPAVLLLDIMAQPIVAFADLNSSEPNELDHGNELQRVRHEHRSQSEFMSIVARRIFSDTPFQSQSTDPKTSSTNKRGQDIPSLVPAYLPLLPSEAIDDCLNLCNLLIGSRRCTALDRGAPPGVTHASLLLLLRMVRSPKNSSTCLRLGFAESVLNLPKECRFTGSAGLVTILLRRLLEDEFTLQASMETEIRSTVTKLHSMHQGGSRESQRVSAPLSSFIDSITPLLCREPISFLRAMAISVKVENKSSEAGVVVLLSAKEKDMYKALLNDIVRPLSIETEAGATRLSHPSTRPRKSSGGISKEKTTHKLTKRGNVSKQSRRGKHEPLKPTISSASSSPANRITFLLITEVMVLTEGGALSHDPIRQTRFLWAGDLLEILADLILAVPACASSVHNYRPHKAKHRVYRNGLPGSFAHALSGLPSPARTFVSFLLHKLLPQDRWSIKNDPTIWERRQDGDYFEMESIVDKKQKAYQVAKLSQTSARVLVALVARPGEGRKRVVSELVFALSGGRLGHGAEGVEDELKSECPQKAPIPKTELHALTVWGELCQGLAAPRSNGKMVDTINSLNIDNVKLMLEHGVAHGLMYSMHRVNLSSPMASDVCASLLLPLELLTRPGVTDTLKAAKDSEERPDGGKGDGAGSSSFERQGDLMSSDGENNGASFPVIEAVQGNARDDGTEEDPDDMEIEEGDVTENDGSNGSEESDSISSDSDESEDDSGHDDEFSTDMDDDEEVSSDEVEEEGEWNVDFGEPYENSQRGDHNDFDEVEDDGTERGDPGGDEGWTRVESSGFGGMVLGGLGRRLNGGPHAVDPNGRARGFIDAAETMIGSLLRTGEISSEAIAEIEGTLGINITTGSRRGRTAAMTVNGTGIDDSFANRIWGSGNVGIEGNSRPEVLGTLPHVHQRSQPDVGYSAFGTTLRMTEGSSMEFVFGGPSVTSGNRSYDTVSPLRANTDDRFPAISQLDLQLFPGGPSSAASARTQQALHPLLCGIDLPPMNSLVSDLLPHGIRATRRGEMTTRRPGNWSNSSFAQGNYLMSTSNGNIVRSSPPLPGNHTGLSQTSGNSSGPVGWTDDGLPFDVTVEQFSSAFQEAILFSSTASTTSPGEEIEGNQEASRLSQPLTSEISTLYPHVEGNPSFSHVETNVDRSITGTPAVSEAHIHEEIRTNSPITSIDGDRVASSLARGLRLSSGSGGTATAEGSVTGEDPPSDSEGDAGENTDENLTVPMNQNGASATERISNDNVPQALDQMMLDERSVVLRPQASNHDASQGVTPNTNELGLSCPPDVDMEVFNSLPVDMQQDCIDHYNGAQELVAQLDGSTLDPEVLAALPEDMRREVIEQERLARGQQDPPADPARAEDMDTASFLASVGPDLREEILVSADNDFLASLPPSIAAEAQILRERASAQHRRLYENPIADVPNQGLHPEVGAVHHRSSAANTSSVRRHRVGKLRVEVDRQAPLYLPEHLPYPVSAADLTLFFKLMYLLSPIRPQRLLQRLFQNLSTNHDLRVVLSSILVNLLHEDSVGAQTVAESYMKEYSSEDCWRKSMDVLFDEIENFPPTVLLGAAAQDSAVDAFSMSVSASLLRRRQGLGTAAAVAANLPRGSAGSHSASRLPPVVATRLIETALQLCKNSPRFSLHCITEPIADVSLGGRTTCFEKFLDLLDKPMFAKSSTNLDQLLSLLEAAISPLSHLSRTPDEEIEIPQSDVEAAALSGKIWVQAPRIEISPERLKRLCSILRMETFRDNAFSKVNTIVRRLCRVESNRGLVLAELAGVAHSLASDSIHDLRALRIRIDEAVSAHAKQQFIVRENQTGKESHRTLGAVSSSVTLSTSTSELKLLRVLQTLQALCADIPDGSSSKKDSSVVVTDELVHILRQIEFDDLWNELNLCLKVVQVLEGVKDANEKENETGLENTDRNDDEDGSIDENAAQTKKLRNSAAGLLTRFLPSIEAFFVANASATRVVGEDFADGAAISLENLVDGKRLLDFVSGNRVLLNALIRNNSGLLDKGLRALVQTPRCRAFLDFDVKRQWFKTQMRRLRQQASRRHGSLRLQIRRKYVFEDAYHQLRLRNADEMRGRLQITFRNEEGVDAGGLSREFFAILAKEIFNPNYALFTSTEDGCTFQPNPNSSINPDHLSYFRFVGRIVGKAVSDGYLLDAHFTRSLYKHMLGLKPTHHDMEAIDPDYYKNLKTILEYNLADIGLDLTFSIDDHSFGRSQVIDLISDGRSVAVTETNKEEYVRMVCQHRMTTAIQSQIKAYLDGFYELVDVDHIAIFTARELELLISGLPDIDVFDLKKNTDYVGWKATENEIEWFWNIMMSLSRNEKATFLQFVTGSSKVPLSGFSELQGMRGIQKFSIHKVGRPMGSLMSAHTCFNSLDLPPYSSEEEMREKFLLAINEGASGFLFA
jgi:E3 ubiquitin-protein ligase HUWE1